MSYNLMQTNALGGTAGGGTGYNKTGAMVADPDIAAQGAQQQALLKQQQDYKTGLLNKLLPMAQGGFGGSGGGGLAQGQLAAAPNYPTGNVQAPHISGGPIWGQQAINQNINANNAKVDQATATGQQNQAGQLAGQGFGARSPLTRALEQMGNQSAMGQKADYSRQFTQTAQEQNRNFGLQADTANANAQNQANQTNLGYANVAQNQYGTLQNALNQQLAAAQSGRNAQTSVQGSLAQALLGLVG